VHDKTVRRRRAVLALLVLLSLILISASVGSSATGPLHAVQSGFLDIVSPIESGAGKVLTPVHDLFKWVDDVFNAASQRDKLRKEYATALGQLAKLQARERENADAAALLHLDRRDDLTADGPVTASITIEPQSLYANTITIDAGSGRGVHVGNPVICATGLVGTVTSVASDASTVTLVNDSTAREAAIDNRTGEFGIVADDPGSPSRLQMQNVAHVGRLAVGDLVVTAGAQVTQHATLFPPNVPIGMIKSLPPAGDDTGPVIIAPTVDFGSIGAVQVLTAVPR